MSTGYFGLALIKKTRCPLATFRPKKVGTWKNTFFLFSMMYLLRYEVPTKSKNSFSGVTPTNCYTLNLPLVHGIFFRGTLDLKKVTWSFAHMDQHAWIWEWLTDGLWRNKASNISTLVIIVILTVNKIAHLHLTTTQRYSVRNTLWSMSVCGWTSKSDENWRNYDNSPIFHMFFLASRAHLRLFRALIN